MLTRPFWWVAVGEWRAQPLRTCASLLAIALGVALGFAVHLINTSAQNEFNAALRSLNGSADLQVRAASGNFDENLYARLAADPRIALASPVIELDVAIAGERAGLKIIGIDPLRAATLTPALIGQQPETADSANAAPGAASSLFDPDALYLSNAALLALGKQVGDTLEVVARERLVRMQIRGVLPAAPAGQRIASMDIAGAQWRLGQLGRINRIDLRLAAGITPAALRRDAANLLPANAQFADTQGEVSQADDVSRAYQVNLNMLALMALLTGAFLVYATQALAVARRGAALALLRVIGLTRPALMRQILGEGVVIGVSGALLGLGLGLLLAKVALTWLGGDLGGGYFSGSTPQLTLAPTAAAVFFVLGVCAALAGSALPAWLAARQAPAQALKGAGAALETLATPRWWPGVLVLGGGVLMAFAPAWNGLPLGGYLAIALLLVGGVMLTPWLARRLLTPFNHNTTRLAPIALDLASKRLWGSANQTHLALCGVVASTSLVMSMGIMIHSFRTSVDTWLEQVVTADLSVRLVGANGAAGVGFDPAQQAAMARVPGVARVTFQKAVPIRLDAATQQRPPVTLLVRAIDRNAPLSTLPLVSSVREIPQSSVPVWVSEAMLDLHGWRLGQHVELPIDTSGASIEQREQRASSPGTTLFVAGVWRDYARQHGTIAMADEDYTRLTGDRLRSDAHIYLSPHADTGTAASDKVVQSVSEALRQLVPAALAARLEIQQRSDIRALSLRIFDRSFAVTYVLQAAALAIGLVGVAASFSAQTLARLREFGVLRHLGVARRQILAMLAIEGSLLGVVGAIAGLTLGLALSQVLIHVINPQSFHWSMDTHVPWIRLMLMAGAMVLAAAGTAVLAGQRALSASALQAVREDW